MNNNKSSKVESPGRPWNYKAPWGLLCTQKMTKLLGSETPYLLILAALVGAGAAYGAIVFRWLILSVSGIVYPAGIKLSNLADLHWYFLLLIPAAGGALIGPLIYFFAPEARGHGVPEVMDAVANQRGRIRARVAAVKIVASAMSIGVGAAVGREGPIVQIGSSLGSSLGQFLHIGSRNLRMLVGCGAAAGIAATFNAPMAGAIFAIEVILGTGTIRMFTPLVVASVVATAISRHYFGDVAAFELPTYSLVSGWELLFYVLLGAFAALVGVGFSRGLYWMEDLWDEIPIHVAAKPILGGLMVGGIAILFPHVMGVGYESIGLALGEGGSVGILMLLGIFVAKMFATHLSLGSGFSGGVFAPSLFLGAVFGAAFGMAVHLVMPYGMVAPNGAYALVAMGAVVAASTHAPLTSILIVFEMTGDYRIMLPLMLACFISSSVSLKLSRESIYTLKLARRGTHMGGRNLDNIMEITTVESHMRPVTQTLSLHTSLAHIVELALKYDVPSLYVVTEAGVLCGVIHQREIRALVREEKDLIDVAIASDLMELPTICALPDDSLADSLKKLSHDSLAELPVVDDEGRLIGTIGRHEILAHYNREQLRSDSGLLEFVEQKETTDREGSIGIPEGNKVVEVLVTLAMAGETLQTLNWRALHGISVIGLRKQDSRIAPRLPESTEALVCGDLLVVSGAPESISRLQELLKAVEENASGIEEA